MGTALLVVDVQNDFLPGGNLAVPGGCAIFDNLRKLQERGRYSHVVFTKDWHPPGHISFATTHGHRPFSEIIFGRSKRPQKLWPDHCIQGTVGAELHPMAVSPSLESYHIITKGHHLGADSYSAFFDNGRKRRTPLHSMLQKLGVNAIHVCGLATDICVMHTAVDALDLGYKVTIVHDASAGVDPSETKTKLAQFERSGGRVESTQKTLRHLRK